MKTLVATLFVVCIGMAVVKADEEHIAKFEQFLEYCAEKEDASQADIDDFVVGKPAVEPEGKCFRACMLENVGSMKNNKFIREGFIVMMDKKFKGDASKMRIANQVADACADVKDSNRCEAGSKISNCLYATGMAKGLF